MSKSLYEDLANLSDSHGFNIDSTTKAICANSNFNSLSTNGIESLNIFKDLYSSFLANKWQLDPNHVQVVEMNADSITIPSISKQFKSYIKNISFKARRSINNYSLLSKLDQNQRNDLENKLYKGLTNNMMFGFKGNQYKYTDIPAIVTTKMLEFD